MPGIIRRFAGAAAVLATVAGGLTFAAAGPASAAGWGCSGSEVSGSPYTLATGGSVYSYVHLFYDSSTGRNCAVNVKVGRFSGVASYTDVELDECAEDTPGTCTPLTKDRDWKATYQYYAGPVSVPGRGHCVRLFAETDDSIGEWYATYDSVGGFHC
jgi:hypothetical protein